MQMRAVKYSVHCDDNSTTTFYAGLHLCYFKMEPADSAFRYDKNAIYSINYPRTFHSIAAVGGRFMSDHQVRLLNLGGLGASASAASLHAHLIRVMPICAWEVRTFAP